MKVANVRGWSSEAAQGAGGVSITLSVVTPPSAVRTSSHQGTPYIKGVSSAWPLVGGVVGGRSATRDDVSGISTGAFGAGVGGALAGGGRARQWPGRGDLSPGGAPAPGAGRDPRA